MIRSKLKSVVPNNTMLTPLSAERVKIQYLQTIETTNEEENFSFQEITEGLRSYPKRLPSKYFYDDHGSQLFEKICELPEYYPTRTEASILNQYAGEIVEVTGNCELIELGSGSSTKTRLLLNAYQKQGGIVKYMPIDVSAAILKESAIELEQEYPSIQIEGFVGTYDQALQKLTLIDSSSRIIFFLGSSMGNFSHVECDKFLEKITKTLKKGDYFLLGIDLQKPISIMEAAYNDSQGVTAAFNLNILAHLNRKFQGNFEPNLFEHQAIYNQEKKQIEMYLVAQQAQEVMITDLDIKVDLKEGEKILTEISRKFDLENIKNQLLSKQLNPLKVFSDSNNWFALILCQCLK